MSDTTVTVSEEEAPEPIATPEVDDVAVTAVAETARDASDAANANENANAAADVAVESATTASENANLAAEAANQANEVLAGIMAAFDSLPGRIAEAVQAVIPQSEPASPLPSTTNAPAVDDTVEPDSAKHWLTRPLFKGRRG